jgi:hypothetical protein
VDRVVGQPGGVVAIRIAAEQPEDALAYQVDQLVLDLAPLAPVPETAGHRLGDPRLAIESLEQHRPAARAGVLGVEPGHDKLVEFERVYSLWPARRCAR